MGLSRARKAQRFNSSRRMKGERLDMVAKQCVRPFAGMTRIRFEGCSRSIAQSQPDNRRPSEQDAFCPDERPNATRY
jgi:hypothetical protein